MSVLFRVENRQLRLIGEPSYTRCSADTLRQCRRHHGFTDGGPVSSTHGLIVHEGDGLCSSCVLLASGGTTGVHEHSAVIVGDARFLAVIGHELTSGRFGLASTVLLTARKRRRTST